MAVNDAMELGGEQVATTQDIDLGVVARGPQGEQGLQGPKGDQGIQGPAGADGKSSYTHIAYANIKFICMEGNDFTLSEASLVRFGSDSRWVYKEFQAGTYTAGNGLWDHDPAVGVVKSVELVSEFSTSNYVDKTHIGIYIDQTATDSNDPAKYAWLLIKGADGAQGPQGPKGETNETATDALNSANSANEKLSAIQANGGGRNLLRYSSGKFQPNSSKIDNYAVFNSAVMTQGQQYTVHASASDGLVWSGTHNPNEESNNVVLWLTDNSKVSQIISDANTGTRTTFTWNHPSGTYYLRVNTYKSDNSGYAEKVMLEKGVIAHDWQPAPEDAQSEIDATLSSKANKSDLTWANISGKPSIPNADDTTIVSSGDLNNYTTTGKYYMPNSLSNYTNRPTTGTDMTQWFVMKVDAYQGGLMIVQTIYQINSGDVWIRQRWSNSWKSWRQINFWS